MCERKHTFSDFSAFYPMPCYDKENYINDWIKCHGKTQELARCVPQASSEEKSKITEKALTIIPGSILGFFDFPDKIKVHSP